MAIGAGETSEARSYGRRASLLSLGVGLTGLITYLFFAIASHELSREDYGQIAVLWSAVFIVVSVLQRPVEQLLSRTVSENLAQGAPIGRTIRVAATSEAADQGVLHDMNQNVHAARDVTKTSAYRVETFQGVDLGGVRLERIFPPAYKSRVLGL